MGASARKKFYHVDTRRSHPHLPLRHPRAPRITLQNQQFFLLPWRQVQQVHDLGDPRPRYPAQPGQIGVVPHDNLSDQSVKMNGECKGVSHRVHAMTAMMHDAVGIASAGMRKTMTTLKNAWIAGHIGLRPPPATIPVSSTRWQAAIWSARGGRHRRVGRGRRGLGRHPAGPSDGMDGQRQEAGNSGSRIGRVGLFSVWARGYCNA